MSCTTVMKTSPSSFVRLLTQPLNAIQAAACEQPDCRPQPLSTCSLPMSICRKSEYASFDPLFWLLHSAVDRCVWLFQNNNHDNGGGWAEPGECFESSINHQCIGMMCYDTRGILQ